WRGAAAPAIASAPAEVVDAGVPAAKKKGKRKGGVKRSGGGLGSALEPEPYEVDDEIVLTDADRALEWRGDAVSLPPRTLDMAGGDEGRPLDDGEIQGGISGGSGPMIGCIKDAVGGAPLSAEVTIQM